MWRDLAHATRHHSDDFAIADLNQDGVLDFAGVNFFSNDGFGFAIMTGLEGGRFTRRESVGLASEVSRVRTADLNQDGRLDLIDLEDASGRIGISRQLPDGSFETVQRTRIAGDLVDVVTNDFNGDGRLDALILSDFPNVTTLLLGDR